MPINRQIREKEVQVIDENGEKVGVLALDAAIEKAEEKDLDLDIDFANEDETEEEETPYSTAAFIDSFAQNKSPYSSGISTL